MPTETLEPRIESSLLYTRGDSGQAFVHDAHKDYFLALALAEKMNNNQIDCSNDRIFDWLPKIPSNALLDAYDIDRVNFLPNRNIWCFIAHYLYPKKVRELVDDIWDYFVRGTSFIMRTGDERYISYDDYFEYPQFCAELIKESVSFPNNMDSKGSYYLIKCIEEVHYNPAITDPSPFWDSWSVPQLAIKAASINGAMEKAQSIVNRWMDTKKRSPFYASYDLSYTTHVYEVKDVLDNILHKKDIPDFYSLYP